MNQNGSYDKLKICNHTPTGYGGDAVLHRLTTLLWGDLERHELRRFFFLASIFFLIIGAYWLMRVMKDAQFALLVGYQYEPIAKMVSVVFVIITLLGYNKLIDLTKKVSLFYFVCFFFGIAFILLGALISLFTAEIAAAPTTLFPLNLSKAVGWLTFCFLESFGSLLPALFWSFVASTTTTESAKKGYALILIFGQVGATLGSLTTRMLSGLGLGTLFACGGCIVLIIPFLVNLYARMIHAPNTNGNHTTGEGQTGIFEGLRLLIQTPYVAGLFVVTTAYEIIANITEYELGLCLVDVYPPLLDGGVGIANFRSLNGIVVGSLALCFALVGTSFFIRRLGPKRCLILFPAALACTVIAVFLFYVTGISTQLLVWLLFTAEVIFKVFNYTLNNPAKEIMYIPTSTNIKFKAKSWIDMIGSRTVKGLGATINASIGPSIPHLLAFGTMISLGITGFWIFVAVLLGNAFDRLQAEKKTVS